MSQTRRLRSLFAMVSERTTSARYPASFSSCLSFAELVEASMTVIESRSTFRSYVATIASMFTHLISRWRQALKRSDQSQMEMDSCFECASMPTTYRGSSSTFRRRCCFFALILLPYKCCRVLEQAGCKVAFKYPGSFAPSRWFPPALKQTLEREPCDRPSS